MAKNLREKQELFIYKNLTDVIICVKNNECRIFADSGELAKDDDIKRIKMQFKKGYKLRFNLSQPR